MLTPQQLLEIVDTMYPLIDELNVWITSDLIKRLMARIGRGERLLLTPTDEWQLQVYQSAGGHLEAVQRDIMRFTKLSDTEVIIDRYNKVAADFENIIAPLENVNINPDGTAEEKDAADQAALKEAVQRLYDACNYLFGGDFAAAFFGKVHPFSPVNGHFYCENALSAVGKYISAQFDREVKKVNSRVERYTHGYRTGKHKDGKK